MALFEGDNFKALNNDAAGDSDNAPLDNFLDHSLRNNEIWLWEFDDPVTYAPYIRDSSAFNRYERIRPFASIGKTTLMTIPWMASRGMKGFRLRLYCRVNNAEATATEGLFVGMKYTGAGRAFDSGNIIVQQSDDFREDHFEWLFDGGVDIHFTNTEKRAQQGIITDALGDLEIYIQSTVDSGPVNTGNNPERRGNAIRQNFIYASDKFGSAFGEQDKALQAVRLDDFGDDSNDRWYDHLYSPSEDLMYVIDKEDPSLYPDSADQARIYNLSYIQIRAIEIQALY